MSPFPCHCQAGQGRQGGSAMWRPRRRTGIAPTIRRVSHRREERPKIQDPLEEGDEIQAFWGQLWFMPSSIPKSPQTRGPERSLVWIRRDLWEKKTFQSSDCYPVGDGDSWVKSPVKLNFAEDLWAKGERETFISVLKRAMAGRGRGRGPRPRSNEEEWEEWGGNAWN